jgi:hypothetical protein
MPAKTRNHVYEVKVDKNKPDNEHIVSKEFLEKCKSVARKYPLK